jgi:hypothetical protein
MFGKKQPVPAVAVVPAEASAGPKKTQYYDYFGGKIAENNRLWVLSAGVTIVAIITLVLLVQARFKPPTVIRILPNGDAAVLGQRGTDGKPTAAIAGADDFSNQAFARRFLESYLNYSPSNVDYKWQTSLNMMTRNLRTKTLKDMTDSDLRDKIDTDQISSVFHLREVNVVNKQDMTYLIYGVKDVHRMKDGYETTDHFVNEYRVRLAADQRNDRNPDGLWVAEFEEKPIDGERRNQILAAPDRDLNP